MGSPDLPVEEGREGDKGKEGSLGWDAQVVLVFSTLSTADNITNNYNVILINSSGEKAANGWSTTIQLNCV